MNPWQVKAINLRYHGRRIRFAGEFQQKPQFKEAT